MTCPAIKEEGSWANVAIAVLCLLGVLAVIKMVSDLIRAYWNFCVQRAAGVDGVRTPRAAYVAQGDSEEGDPPEATRAAYVDPTTSSSDGVRSRGPKSRTPSPPEHEPMYVPEMNSTSSPWTPDEKDIKNGLPQTIFLFRSGECYHTEPGCRYIVTNPLAPTKRRLCTCCEALTNRRIREQQKKHVG